MMVQNLVVYWPVLTYFIQMKMKLMDSEMLSDSVCAKDIEKGID